MVVGLVVAQGSGWVSWWGPLFGPKPISEPFSEWVRNLQPAPMVGSTQHDPHKHSIWVEYGPTQPDPLKLINFVWVLIQ